MKSAVVKMLIRKAINWFLKSKYILQIESAALKSDNEIDDKAVVALKVLLKLVGSGELKF